MELAELAWLVDHIGPDTIAYPRASNLRSVFEYPKIFLQTEISRRIWVATRWRGQLATAVTQVRVSVTFAKRVRTLIIAGVAGVHVTIQVTQQFI